MIGARALTAAAAAVGLLGGPAVAATYADTTPTPTPSGTPTAGPSGLPVTVELGGVSPLAPQPGDTLAVRGTLRNVSSSPITGLTVRLAISPSKITSRGEFDSYADTPDGPPPVDGVVPAAETSTLPHTDLAIGDSEAFSVSVPVDDLGSLTAWQVYEMGVTVEGETVAGTSIVGQLRTFLPWAPLGVPGVGAPTRLAWVWPLDDRPHRTTSSTWVDDGLAGQLAPAGRLGRLVAAAAAAEEQHPPPPPAPPKHRRGKHHRPAPQPPAQPRPQIRPVPVTWAIDPMLIDDAKAMQSGYTVGTGSDTRPGTGKDAAKTWIAALGRATSSAELFGMPYGDPDVAAAARNGLGTDVQVAANLGDHVLSDALHQPLPYAWPPDGLADRNTLDTFFAAGRSTVVLSGAALPAVPAPNETLGAHATVRSRDFTFNALLADDTLNQVVDAGGRSAQDGPLETQRLLSELLMVQAERPSQQRSLVITPSRRWNPSASFASTVLADTGQVPWIEPVALSRVATAPIDDVPRAQLAYSDFERQQQLSRNYLQRVKDIKRRVDAFASILIPTGDPTARGFDDGVLRLLSSAWRGNPTAARTERLALDDELRTAMGKVYIASAKEGQHNLVTLTSHSGTVPVTVANDLDSPVVVVVKIDGGPRLRVRGGGVLTRIPAHRRIPVDVRATAQTSGVFPLTVELLTRDRHRYGPVVSLSVRSTAYGATALLITGGATAVLLLTVVVRLLRRARTARRTARAPA